MAGTVRLDWDGRPADFDVDQLETAWLVYQDAEGDGVARKVATARTLAREFGWSFAEAVAYAVVVTKWSPGSRPSLYR